MTENVVPGMVSTTTRAPSTAGAGDGSNTEDRSVRHAKRAARSWFIVLAAFAFVAAACSGSDDSATDGTSADAPEESVTVTPDYDGGEITVNVVLTDEGFEPETIFLPAGRHIRLVLRNRGKAEHHFRVARLVPADMRWFLVPEVDEAEVESPAART